MAVGCALGVNGQQMTVFAAEPYDSCFLPSKSSSAPVIRVFRLIVGRFEIRAMKVC